MAQNPESADERQVTARGFFAGISFLQQELIGFQFFSQGDRFPLAVVQIIQPRIGLRLQRPNLEPGRGTCKPSPDLTWRERIIQLVENGRRIRT